MKALRLLLILALGALDSTSLLADDQPPATNPAPPITDPAQIAAHYHEVLQRPAFEEVEEPDVDSRLRDWLSQWFMHLGAKFGEFKYASDIPGVASLFLTLLVFLLLTGLLYVGYRLTRRHGSWDAIEKEAKLPETKLPPPEFYDQEIAQAVSRADWRAAWLSAWRQFLSRIEWAHLVETDRTRTNREYLTQLRSKSLPAPTLTRLVSLVDSYDNFVYGRRGITEADWTEFRTQLRESELMLNLHGTPPSHRSPA